MCPADDSHLTIEFKDYFVIEPSIVFFLRNQDFTKNKLNESGTYVEQGVEYNSGTNPYFLNIDEIISYNKNV